MSETVGEKLIKARLQREKTLEEAARVTRVKLKYLEALENDQPEKLPSLTQARGFLRLYCDYLGIPTQPLLNIWDGIPEEPPPPPPEPVKRVILPEPEPEEPLVAPDGEPSPMASREKILEPMTTSEAIFRHLGDKLRRQRELLKLSLTDVETLTRIRQPYLIALENGSLADLPSPVQGRGMLINYARFLELDVDEMLSLYADGLQFRLQETRARGTPANQPVEKSTPPRVKPGGIRRFLSIDMLAGGFIIIALVGFAIWSAAEVSAITTAEAEATGTAIALETLGTATPTPSQTPTPGDTATPEGTSGTNGNLPQVTITLPPLDNNPIQVLVVARMRAWMKVTVDGKVAFEGRIVPGTAYPYSGSNQIELLTGNAAAIQVFYNRRDLGAQGAIGQIASIVFTREEIITPTPQFQPTPTETITPTPAPATVTPTPTETIIIP